MGHGMEDYLAAENRQVNGHQLGLYAIFDGHSGKDVAKYLRSHLFDNILNQPDFWESPKAAIRRAYKATNEEVLEKVVGDRRGGSTAVTAILVDGKTLVVANVGDSRAVLCRNGVAKQISVDHEPEKERELVENRGGLVIQLPGNIPRVDGELAMSRAFGDADLKDHISSDPDLKIVRVDPSASDLIILASDGIWKDPTRASKTLIAQALAKGSQDDISCIVVMIH
ncbi:Probable protein phosphatase 2C 28 [Linum grandiflorum]